jgi:membrane protein YqaA with SNARE-associated domain
MQDVSKKSWGPFVTGAVVGSVAGATVGVLLSQHVGHLIASFVGVMDRKLSEAERERVRFDLLLQ